MAFALDSVTVFDAIYVSLLMVVFILLAFVCQRKTWMWIGTTTQSLFGVAFLLVPAHVLKYQVS